MSSFLKRYTVSVLRQRFGTEWSDLGADHAALVLADFHALCTEEYDAFDDTNAASEDAIDLAGIEYRRSIGGGNLKAYAETLAVGARRNVVA